MRKVSRMKARADVVIHDIEKLMTEVDTEVDEKPAEKTPVLDRTRRSA